ncbi:MAG: metallophosphoesterase [Nitrospirota bacterium]|jgi:putative phosphoesterase
MLIGLISDTHDDMQQIRKVVNLFNSKGISEVVHAGDLVSPFTFEILGDLRAGFRGIFGNNDGDRLLLREKSGDAIRTQPYLFELGGKKIALVHEPASVEALAASGRFDLVVYGHTHTPDVRKVNGTLVVNPGKVAKLHKGRSTAVILDTERMEPEVIEL